MIVGHLTSSQVTKGVRVGGVLTTFLFCGFSFLSTSDGANRLPQSVERPAPSVAVIPSRALCMNQVQIDTSLSWGDMRHETCMYVMFLFCTK